MDTHDTQQNGPEEGPNADEPNADEPTADEPTAERPSEDGPKADEPAAERPTEDGPKADEPAPERPSEDGPKADEPAAGQPAPERPAQPRRRLTRSRDDRVIAGVCGGVARYFDIDPVLARIGAVALAFVGGAGLLLYLAALLLMPSDEAGAPAQSGGQGRNRALVIVGVGVLLLVAWPFLLGGGLFLAGIGIPFALLVGAGVLVWWLVSGEGPSGDARDVARRAALGVGVLVLCGLVFVGGAVAMAAGPDWLVAALVIAAGAAVVAGAFLKPIRWLVPPALTLALAAGVVAAAGIDVGGGVGEREYRPASSTDLRDRYELGIGELRVDLRDTRLPAGDVPLEMDVGVGEARLIVPEEVCVATSADVGIGNVSMFGHDNGGIDVDFEDSRDATPDTTRLVLDAKVGLGEVRVEGAGSGCESAGERAIG